MPNALTEKCGRGSVRWIFFFFEVDGHLGGVCVLLHPSFIFRRDSAEKGGGWRWTLGCERHSLSFSNHSLQQASGWG